MSANRLTVLIAALAVVAIAIVVVAGVGGGGGDGDAPAPPAAEAPSATETPPAAEPEAETDEAPAGTPAPNSDAHAEAHAREREREAAPPEIPDDPDAVRGSAPYALTRPANLRRALAVLERRRARVRGAFDGLRIAPGRLDTVIVHPDDRRTNIQVRADLSVAFESTHDFPTQADFRERGLTARDVPVRAPARLLRSIDRRRRGSAAHDVDYVVVGRDIIDGGVDVAAYMRIRTARPRYFRLEGGRAEAFG